MSVVKRIVVLCSCLICFSAHAKNLKHSGHSYVFLEGVTWQVRDGSSINWAQIITADAPMRQATLVDAPFGWQTGLRAGVGYNTRTGWDLLGYYTWYQSRALNNASGHVFSAFLGNFFANNTNGNDFGPFYQEGQVDWGFHYNTLDVELGKHFHISPSLAVKPFIGLKAAAIDQRITSYWQGPLTTVLGAIVPINTFSQATEILEQDFYGIGPSIGINSKWLVHQADKQSVHILGDVSGALMGGRWRFSEVYSNNTPLSIQIKTQDITGAAPMAKGRFGLEWDNVLGQVGINLSLAYEAQVWFNQMRFYSFNMGRLNHLLSLHGGNLAIAVSLS